MDLGSLPKIPDWALRLIVWLAALGGVAIIAGLILGIVWLCSHLSWS